jgi:hypothetical protein
MQSTYSEGFEEMPLVRAESQSTIIALNVWNNTESGGSHKEEPSSWEWKARSSNKDSPRGTSSIFIQVMTKPTSPNPCLRNSCWF